MGASNSTGQTPTDPLITYEPIPSYTLVNGHIKLEMPWGEDSSWAVTLFGRNLTDKQYVYNRGSFFDTVAPPHLRHSHGCELLRH